MAVPRASTVAMRLPCRIPVRRVCCSSQKAFSVIGTERTARVVGTRDSGSATPSSSSSVSLQRRSFGQYVSQDMRIVTNRLPKQQVEENRNAAPQSLAALVPTQVIPTAVQRTAYESLFFPLPAPPTSPSHPENCIVRCGLPRNLLQRNSFKEDLYPTTPHNYTPLRPSTEPGLSPLGRAVREVPWESRFELMKRRTEPKYCSEVRGTPRREYQEGMVEGCRVRPVFNPFVELTPAKRYRMDNWPSRREEEEFLCGGGGGPRRGHVEEKTHVRG